MSHYYEGKPMPMIKHGFMHASDDNQTDFINWANSVNLSIVNDGIGHDVKSVSFNKEHVVFTMVDDSIVETFPGQISIEQLNETTFYVSIKTMADFVKQNAHAIPAMFDYLLENYKALGFHPTKTPRTIKLLKDISIHLLRPMEADCPNENMQEAVQEILWHVNKHVKPGDFLVLRSLDTNKLSALEVIHFDDDTAVFDCVGMDTGETVSFHYADTNLVIVKYFGVERWAYPNQEEARAAASEFHSKLVEQESSL